MWNPFTKDSDLMDDLAHDWALRIANGYFLPRSRDHKMGLSRNALKKYLKPGRRPICILDAIRRLGCKASFTP